MTPIEAFHWNPRRPRYKGRIGRLLPLRHRLNNFGDLLGPLVINELVRQEGLEAPLNKAPKRLLSIGSVLHFAQDGDTIWGTGVNGKFAHEPLAAANLDVRAVRGPLTRSYLLEHGVQAPAIYGDPGLLVSTLWPELKANKVIPQPTVIMNFNDAENVPAGVNLVSPLSPVDHCLRQLASSSLVIGSSLHAIIIAESFGVPARLVRSNHEPEFKYHDYYAGTGRTSYKAAETVEEAIELGGERPLTWNPDKLIEAFPRDLWATKVNR